MREELPNNNKEVHQLRSRSIFLVHVAIPSTPNSVTTTTTISLSHVISANRAAVTGHTAALFVTSLLAEAVAKMPNGHVQLSPLTPLTATAVCPPRSLLATTITRLTHHTFLLSWFL